MFDLLRRPLSPGRLLALAGAVTLTVALYCVAYTVLAGRPDSYPQALGWAIANICPWLIALEAGKRVQVWTTVALTLAAALMVSLALGYVLRVSAEPLLFEAVRRVPALGASAAAIGLLRSRVGQKTSSEPMKLLPRQIDWVRAAGNYVEVRAGGRTIVQRASIGSVERELATHGFVRIHRSTLVRRDRIARIRPQDVVLHDGTHLPVGKRYRAALAA
jgi:DNA-binding LytR/AlgR family response regulator